MNIPTARPFGDTTNSLADRAAQGAEGAIRSTQRVANDAIDHLAQSAENMRDKAGHLARRGVEVVRDGSLLLRDTARHATEGSIVYIREEPVKAVLISAAIGAGLMALLSALSRSRA